MVLKWFVITLCIHSIGAAKLCVTQLAMLPTRRAWWRPLRCPSSTWLLFFFPGHRTHSWLLGKEHCPFVKNMIMISYSNMLEVAVRRQAIICLLQLVAFFSLYLLYSLVVIWWAHSLTSVDVIFFWDYFWMSCGCLLLCFFEGFKILLIGLL